LDQLCPIKPEDHCDLFIDRNSAVVGVVSVELSILPDGLDQANLFTGRPYVSSSFPIQVVQQTVAGVLSLHYKNIGDPFAQNFFAVDSMFYFLPDFFVGFVVYF
jgi:hypothetical protein